MSINSSDSLVQLPVGFRSCTRPFGRLLALFDAYFVQRPKSRLNAPLRWLLQRIAQNRDDDSQKIKHVTFNPFNIVFVKLLNHAFILKFSRATLSIGFSMLVAPYSTALASMCQKRTVVKNELHRGQSV